MPFRRRSPARPEPSGGARACSAGDPRQRRARGGRRRRRFLNAGSVGLPYEGDGAARWLWISDGVPELRRTAYDAAAAGERMLAGGWPDERSVRAALTAPVDPLVVTEIFEGMATG